MSEHGQALPMPFDALDDSTWGNGSHQMSGPLPVNITLSVSELLMLRDVHQALMANADHRPVRGWYSEHEFHDIRAQHFGLLASYIAPALVGPSGNPPMRLVP